MSGFDNRTGKALPFEDALTKDLEGQGFCVARNGTEHTFPEFTGQLRRSNDSTSLAIRFQPDGVACIGRIPRSFYWEAKASRKIEKTAYEQYMAIHRMGGVLVVVFQWDTGDWRWNFIEDVRLIPGSDTVSKFPPDRRFPVVNEWITPRGSQRWEIVKSNSSQASGTPYREVNEASLLKWNAFKPAIVERLSIATNIWRHTGQQLPAEVIA